jgi:hypothetical protein
VPPEPTVEFNSEAAVASFLAEEGGGAGDAPAGAATEPAATDDDGTAEPAGDEPAAEGDADEPETSEDADSDETAEPEKPASAEREPTELEKAIAAKDVKAFIAALGDAANDLLGGKAHKALRLAAKELRDGEERLAKSAKALTERFADPTAAFEAAKKGPEGADAFVEAIERQAGASWADIVKYVNESQAGKDARLQARAKADAEKTSAEQAKRAEHERTLRTLITDTVKVSDSKLLEADPEIVDDVFRVMKTGWSKGINTPAKALAVVKKRLEALAKVLAPAPAASKPKLPPPRRPTRNGVPQPRVPQSKGAPILDAEEMVSQFLREDGYHGR